MFSYFRSHNFPVLSLPTTLYKNKKARDNIDYSCHPSDIKLDTREKTGEALCKSCWLYKGEKERKRLWKLDSSHTIYKKKNSFQKEDNYKSVKIPHWSHYGATTPLFCRLCSTLWIPVWVWWIVCELWSIKPILV